MGMRTLKVANTEDDLKEFIRSTGLSFDSINSIPLTAGKTPTMQAVRSYAKEGEKGCVFQLQ